MAFRMLELESKVRTPQSEQVERVFRENLCDLRTLVAKEYCTMIIGTIIMCLKERNGIVMFWQVRHQLMAVEIIYMLERKFQS